MNPQTPSASDHGMSQPANDMGQLPPIHTPDNFHAPEVAAPHFSASGSGGQLPSSPPGIQPIAPPVTQHSLPGSPSPVSASLQAQVLTQPAPGAPAEEADTAFDEVWVGKARAVVEQMHADPFTQSKELSKLKAQYIKARYNKDVKVSED